MYTTTTTLSIDNVQSILSLSLLEKKSVCVCVEARPSRYMYTDEIRKEKKKDKKNKIK